MREKPIGVFDSGLGGLTVVNQLHRALPHEDIIYFGDTGRVPYGTRSNETILKYAKQDMRFLQGFDLKQIVVACGTVSSVLEREQAPFGEVPVMTIVAPTAARACQLTKTGRIGVIGTTATIKSRSYERAILARMPLAQVVSQDCPLFVPLAECGFADSPSADFAAGEYLKGIREKQVDTLILGCTHYPLLRKVIRRQMGEQVTLVDPGEACALQLRRQLEEQGLLSLRDRMGQMDYYVSDSIENFGGMGEAILGEPILQRVKKIDIERY